MTLFCQIMLFQITKSDQKHIIQLNHVTLGDGLCSVSNKHVCVHVWVRVLQQKQPTHLAMKSVSKSLPYSYNEPITDAIPNPSAKVRFCAVAGPTALSSTTRRCLGLIGATPSGDTPFCPFCDFWSILTIQSDTRSFLSTHLSVCKPLKQTPSSPGVYKVCLHMCVLVYKPFYLYK